MSRVTLVLSILAALIFISCTKSDKDLPRVQPKKVDSSVYSTDEQIYVCTFHPLQRSDKPGKCPLCGREMVNLVFYDQEMTRKNEEMKKKMKTYIGAAYTVIDLSVIKSGECEKILAGVLSNKDGLLDAQIDIVNRHIAVFFEPRKIKEEDLIKLITEAGFDANKTKATQQAIDKLPDECK